MDVKLLGGGGGNMCHYCLPMEGDIQLEKLVTFMKAEYFHARLWRRLNAYTVTSTQKYFSGDGRACRFYSRNKVQANARLAMETLNKFLR